MPPIHSQDKWAFCNRGTRLHIELSGRMSLSEINKFVTRKKSPVHSAPRRSKRIPGHEGRGEKEGEEDFSRGRQGCRLSAKDRLSWRVRGVGGGGQGWVSLPPAIRAWHADQDLCCLTSSLFLSLTFLPTLFSGGCNGEMTMVLAF